MITRASIEDAERILGLQKTAYRSEALLYDDFSIPPLTQDLEELEEEFATKVVLKQVLDAQLVGSVRASEKGNTCYVERLIVHPDYQGRGIGTALMCEVERVFPNANRFELFTGHKSAKNIGLYKKLGYRTFKQEPMSDNVIHVFLEKHCTATTTG